MVAKLRFCETNQVQKEANRKISNPKYPIENRACHHSIKIESRSNPEAQISEVA